MSSNDHLVGGSTYKGNDDLAIRGRLEVVGSFELFSEPPVIVDLPIDRQGDRLILVGQGLGPAL